MLPIFVDAGTNEGMCASCRTGGVVCPALEYPVGCGGLTPGHCAPCVEDCGPGRARAGCGVVGLNQSEGSCEDCPSGTYRYPGQQGRGCRQCSALSVAFGCSRLEGCGGATPGACMFDTKEYSSCSECPEVPLRNAARCPARADRRSCAGRIPDDVRETRAQDLRGVQRGAWLRPWRVPGRLWPGP